METAVDKPMVLFVILDSIFIVLQVCVLAGVFVSLRKLTSSVERIRADV